MVRIARGSHLESCTRVLHRASTVVFHSSRSEDEENLKHLVSLLGLFSVHLADGPRPTLVLQGALPRLETAAPLVALARVVRVERSAGIVSAPA